MLSLPMADAFVTCVTGRRLTPAIPTVLEPAVGLLRQPPVRSPSAVRPTNAFRWHSSVGYSQSELRVADAGQRRLSPPKGSRAAVPQHHLEALPFEPVPEQSSVVAVDDVPHRGNPVADSAGRGAVGNVARGDLGADRRRAD